MAAILLYSGVKGYQIYQAKRASLSAESQSKSKKNRKSIASLVIPSVASAHIVPRGEESYGDLPPDYESMMTETSFENWYPHSSYSSSAPIIPLPRSPVMLGITLCESPTTPSGLDGDSPIEFGDCRLDHPSFDHTSHIHALPSDTAFPVATMSPRPLMVVKRKPVPVPAVHEEPEMTYSSDESEELEEVRPVPERYAFLQIPTSAKLLDLEPPPIPAKSPARKLRPSNLRIVTS